MACIVYPIGRHNPCSYLFSSSHKPLLKHSIERVFWSHESINKDLQTISHLASVLSNQVGDPILEVVGERELAFFPGTAVGSAYKGGKKLYVQYCITQAF